MKIVVLDGDTLPNSRLYDELAKYGELIIYKNTENRNQVIERLQHATIAITNKVVLDSFVLNQLNLLQFIAVIATGLNNIDIDAAEKNGIIVKNAVGYSTESVAQRTFAMLLSLLERLHYYDKYVKGGEYSKSNLFTHIGPEYHLLNKRTFGIIGLGNIGSKVANIAEAFGCRVIYYSITGLNVNTIYERVSFDELLKQSDFISIHSPLTENTYHLIGEPELKKMKQSAFLVNTGRGGIIDESALSIALKEDFIAGAALDVYEEEPISNDSPLLKDTIADKLLFTPHSAWTASEAREKLIDITLKNISDFINQQSS